MYYLNTVLHVLRILSPNMPLNSDIVSESNLSKRSSETKLHKSNRKSRLPKSSPNKSNRPKTTESEGNQLDFPTRMKLKEKISELQQLNNELRFKLTTTETKLKGKDSELIAAESLNKQIKQLLDKHITHEQELNGQILNLEKRVTKTTQQMMEMEEGILTCIWRDLFVLDLLTFDCMV